MKSMFTALKLSALLAISLITTSTYAASYSFNYEVLDSSHFQAISGDFGSNINIGDTVTLTLTTPANSIFYGSNGDYMWAILGLFDSAGGSTRTADYSWSFYDQGTQVGSGSSINETTSFIHMGPYVSINFNGFFDTYIWTGTLNSSISGNDNIAFDISTLSGTSAQFITATVPEPETYALCLAGLACLGLVAKKKKV
jgi:hypothetical protein